MQYYFEDIYVIPLYSINTYLNLLKLKNPLNAKLFQIRGDHRKKQISGLLHTLAHFPALLLDICFVLKAYELTGILAIF